MIELSGQVHHAQCQGSLGRICIAVNENIVIGPVFLNVRVFHRPRDVCVSIIPSERLRDL